MKTRTILTGHGLATCLVVMGLYSRCTPYCDYTPDPVKDIDQWVAGFEHQKSFHYRYEMKTAFTGVKSSGECLTGWAEHNRGEWRFGDSTVAFEHYGMGDREYRREGRTWIRSARGDESDFFSQIRRVFSFDTYEYIGDSAGYLYRFKANAPFLAPDRWKEMIGWLKISKKTYLPEFVWAGLPDSSVWLQATFGGYGRAYKIEPPIRETNQFTIAGDTGAATRHLADAIARRLRLMDIPAQVRWAGGTITAVVPGHCSIGTLRDALANPPIAVHGVTENKDEAVRTIARNDDPGGPLYLSSLIATPATIKDARVGFDPCSRLVITLVLREKKVLPKRVCLDDGERIIGFGAIDKAGKTDTIIVYADIGFRDLVRYCAMIRQALPALMITTTTTKESES